MDDAFLIRPITPPDVDTATGLVALADEERADESEQTRGLLRNFATGRMDEVTASSGVQVAVHRDTNRVVGVVVYGAPGVWAVRLYKDFGPAAARQTRSRVGEIYQIAVIPEFRRKGIGTALMNAALKSRPARSWRVALWFWNDRNKDATRFHRALATEWPHGKRIHIADPAGNGIPLRDMVNGLHASVYVTHPDTALRADPQSQFYVIDGVFDGGPWQSRTGQLGPRAQMTPPAPARPRRPSKADKKAEKKARGRARG